MTVERVPFEISGRDFSFELERRARKTLEIAVTPNGALHIVAPQEAELDAIYEKVRKRALWIKEKQAERSGRDARPESQYYATGSAFRYLGQTYRMKVDRSIRTGVFLSAENLIVHAHRPKRTAHVAGLIDGWLKVRCKEIFFASVEKLASDFPDPERVRPSQIKVRRMKTRWGSMTPSGTLTLNPRLIEHPPQCIDYVVAHELAHRVYDDHGKAFWRLLADVMPDWKRRKTLLESDP